MVNTLMIKSTNEKCPECGDQLYHDIETKALYCSNIEECDYERPYKNAIKKIIYIAGAYMGEPHQVEIDADTTRMAVLSVIMDGNYPFMPIYMHGAVQDEFFIEGGVHMLSMCDEVLSLPNWEHSNVTSRVVEAARENNMPIRQYVHSDDFV